MNKKRELSIARTGIALTMAMFFLMVVEALFPHLLPEAPGWLSALSILICICLPALFCSILGSRVPTYKTEDWSSDTPNGVGTIAIAATSLMTVIAVPVAFLPIPIKQSPEARIMYGMLAMIFLLTLSIEKLSLNRWRREFHKELSP